jgi:hypothetical protein
MARRVRGGEGISFREGRAEQLEGDVEEMSYATNLHGLSITKSMRLGHPREADSCSDSQEEILSFL